MDRCRRRELLNGLGRRRLVYLWRDAAGGLHDIWGYRVHTLTRPALAGLAAAVVLTGCASSGTTTSPAASATPRPSASSTPGAGATSAAPSGAPSSRSGDRRFSGLIGSTGLTCVVFQSDRGDRYALTGGGVTPEVRRIAESGRSLPSLDGQPTGTPQVVHVTLFGTVHPDLASPCGLAVLVTTSVTIGQPA